MRTILAVVCTGSFALLIGVATYHLRGAFFGVVAFLLMWPVSSFLLLQDSEENARQKALEHKREELALQREYNKMLKGE